MNKSESDQAIISRRFTRIFALLVILIGLFVLIGWYGRLMFLTRFSINEVPMPLSTAYVFVSLTVGLWCYLRPQKVAINRIVAIVSALIVLSLSSLFVMTNIFEYYSHWEHAFIDLPHTHLDMQIGHMSLVSAIMFHISGLALLLLRSKRKIVKALSIILTLILFITSFILLLGYGFGAPFFYFGNFIPPAGLTVLSFLLVSLALIAASDKNTFFMKTIWKTSTSAQLLRVFLPTTIVITVIQSFIAIRIFPLFDIHPAIGVSLVSFIVLAVVIVVISIISKRIGKILDSALEDLSKSEAKFRIFFENSPIGKSMTGIDGSMNVNQSFCNMVGYSEEELRVKSWMDITHPDEIQETTDLSQSLLRGEISQARFEKRYIHKDGSIVFADVSTYLQRDTDDNPLFFITSILDITERKRTNEALLENQRRYKKAQAIAHVGNWEYDPLTTEFWGSDEAGRIYGLDSKGNDFTTEDVENCIPERERVHQALIDLMEHHKKYDLVFDILTADKGIRKTIHSIAELERDAQGNPIKITGVINDISHMIQAQEIVLTRNKEMENYLYIASHDLRTPLVNIQGFSLRLKKQTDSIKTLLTGKAPEQEILQKLGKIIDENIPRTLSFIISNIEKMDSLINGLLQLSRTGRVDMNIQEIDMNALLAKTVQSLDFQIKEARCEIHIKSLPECFGDAALLDQLFANIISNALKYSDSERTLLIIVDGKKTYNRVLYTVRDTGRGIAGKYLEKIWNVFYRIDPHSEISGEGIGLSLVKRIAEKHRGKVWVESEENKGTVFQIELHNRPFSEI